MPLFNDFFSQGYEALGEAASSSAACASYILDSVTSTLFPDNGGCSNNILSASASASSVCDPCQGAVKEKVLKYEQVTKAIAESPKSGRPTSGDVRLQDLSHLGPLTRRHILMNYEVKNNRTTIRETRSPSDP